MPSNVPRTTLRGQGGGPADRGERPGVGESDLAEPRHASVFPILRQFSHQGWLWFNRGVDAESLRQIIDTMPFAELLGIEYVAATPEQVRARLAWDQSRCTTGGVLHGGALMGLADSTGGLCAFLNLPKGATGTATIESKTNFFAAVRSGHVEARSRPLHKGRMTVVIETDIHDANGRHVARVTQTQAVLGG